MRRELFQKKSRGFSSKKDYLRDERQDITIDPRKQCDTKLSEETARTLGKVNRTLLQATRNDCGSSEEVMVKESMEM